MRQMELVETEARAWPAEHWHTAQRSMRRGGGVAGAGTSPPPCRESKSFESASQFAVLAGEDECNAEDAESAALPGAVLGDGGVVDGVAVVPNQEARAPRRACEGVGPT